MPKKTIKVVSPKTDAPVTPNKTAVRRAPEVQRLFDMVEAAREKRRRNPPKTDYVLPSGKMLPVPENLLTPEKAVLGMYDHLHEFCANSVVPYDGIYREEDNPVNCLKYMHQFDCISLGELREILRIPLQIRHLHEHLFRRELWSQYPYGQFQVEFVEMLRFMLRLKGYVVPSSKVVRRYCYCWDFRDPRPSEEMFTKDELARSYEQETLSNKAFLEQWGEFRSSVPAKKWIYCKYQDWFLAFDDKGEVDIGLTETAINGWQAPEDNSKLQFYLAGFKNMGLKSVLRSFCNQWALTHLGTPISEVSAGCPVMLRAERVEVVLKRDNSSPLPVDGLSLGFDVHLPKYCKYAAISKYQDKDFEQLKYALKHSQKGRRHTSKMPLGQMKRLLRLMKDILERHKVPKGDTYRILKMLANQLRASGDSTMRGYGFIAPKKLVEKGEVVPIKNGEVVPMKPHEAFVVAMKATFDNLDDQKIFQEVFAGFEIDVAVHLHGMAVNMA